MANSVAKFDVRQCWLAIPVLALFVLVVIPLIALLNAAAKDGTGSLSPQVTQLSNIPLYLKVFANTFQISAMVTAVAVIIAFPIAYTAIHGSSVTERLLLGISLASMWLSVLVRSYAWTVLLERRGPISQLLGSIGVNAMPELLFTKAAVIVGMVHVLTPYIVIAIWSSASGIAKRQYALASSLGATRIFYVSHVYLRTSLPGVLVGSCIVFLLSLGFLITPELLGGGQGSTMMIGVLIDEQMNQLGNWSEGASLALSLLLVIAALIALLVFLWSTAKRRTSAYAD